MVGVGLLLPAMLAAAADAPARRFDLPAGDAVQTLKQFATQAGAQILYSAKDVGGIATKALQGEFPPLVAIERMLQGTPLKAREDPATRAIAVTRAAAPSRAPPSAADSPAPPPETTKTVQPNHKKSPPVKKSPFHTLRAWLGLALAPASIANAADGSALPAGTIEGQVSNAVTNQNLEYAQVELLEKRLSLQTDRAGFFRFTGLEPGRYTLAVNYIGLDPRQVSVEVTGGRVQIDVPLNSGVYVLPAFTVPGDREGNAAAIVQQKNAPNIQTAMTADAFGDIAKMNIGNFLKRMPGVASLQGIGDLEPNTVSVRGMASSQTSVDVDGTRSALPSEGDRTQNIAAVPAGTIEKIEVVKAPTPEDDADSIGGRIKLTTKSGFDQQGRRIELRAGSAYDVSYGNSLTRYSGKSPFTQNAGLTFSDVLSVFGGRRNLGLTATGSFDKYENARSIAYYGPVSAAGSGAVVAPGQVDYKTYSSANYAAQAAIRGGGNIRADYKLGDNTFLRVSSGFNRHDFVYQRGIEYFTGGTIDLAKTTPLFVVRNNVQNRAQRDFIHRRTFKYTHMVAVKSDWRTLKVDFDVVVDRAHLNEYRNIAIINSANRFSYSFDSGAKGEYAGWPKLTTLAGVDPFDDVYTSLGTASSYEVTHRQVTENVTGSHLNFTKSLALRVPVELKFGGRWREDDYRFNRKTLMLDIPAGANLSGYLDQRFRYSIGEYPPFWVPDIYKLFPKARYIGGADPRTAWAYTSDLMTLNPTSTVQNSLLPVGTLKEDVYAGYVQGRAAVGRLGVLAGVRLEAYRQKQDVGVQNATAADLIQRFGGRKTSSAGYDHWFPSLHLRYALTNDFLLRAAWSNTVGRPNRSVLLTQENINLTAQTITAPNPDLQPQYSRNLDLSIERYFKSVGLVSLGAFDKEINNYISTQTTTVSSATAAALGAAIPNPSEADMTWRLTTQRNLAKARARGVELSYSQQLSFLPGLLSSTGVFVNGTWLRSQGYTTVSNGVATPNPLAGFLPRSINAGLSYNRNGLDLRVHINAMSSYLLGLNLTNPLLGNGYSGKRRQFDANLKYKLRRNLTLFCDFNNFTREGQLIYVGYIAPERLAQHGIMSFSIAGGLTYSFAGR
jgi:TonB-dependent receptor